MYNGIPHGLPHLKKIVLLIFGVVVCLAGNTSIRAIAGTTSFRIAASPTGNILSRSFVQAGDNTVRAPNPARTLSFAERVSYQRVIEEVYWRHRIWPKERPDPKPSLDTVMSQAQLEKKVEDYLRNSQALEDHRQGPLTAEQLQAEMERMAQHTRQPEVLRELFEALGNDPVIIAECVARPALVERLRTKFYGRDQVVLGSGWARAQYRVRNAVVGTSAHYTLPRISSGPSGCVDDTWTAT